MVRCRPCCDSDGPQVWVKPAQRATVRHGSSGAGARQLPLLCDCCHVRVQRKLACARKIFSVGISMPRSPRATMMASGDGAGDRGAEVHVIGCNTMRVPVCNQRA